MIPLSGNHLGQSLKKSMYLRKIRINLNIDLEAEVMPLNHLGLIISCSLLDDVGIETISDLSLLDLTHAAS